MGVFRDQLERVAERVWYPERGLAFAALLPFLGPATWVTAALSRRRERRQATAPRARVPVLAIGNLAVGGTGKTQVVAALAERALTAGRKVAIVTRGYGGTEPGPQCVPVDGEVARFGDEAILLARRLRHALVIVARDRAAGVALAMAQGSALVFFDDGLQQTQIAPARRIVVFGAESVVGNGALLPLGPLRDPLSRLRGDDLVWVHGEAAGTGDAALPRVDVRSRTVAVPLPELSHGALTQGCPVFAFAGIARPERFFHTLGTLGVSIVGTARYADHRRFTPRELTQLRARAVRLGAQVLVCTEKDGVRLPTLATADKSGQRPDATQGALPIVPLETRLEIVSGEEKVAELLALPVILN